MDGFANLCSTNDLFRKLKHDVSRLRDEPASAYRAFDVFVTGEHLVDWVYPGIDKEQREKRKTLRDSEQILQVCSHVANGGKHFRAEAKHHDSVTGIHLGGVYGGVYNHGDGDVFGSVYGAEVVIHLTGDPAKEFGDSPTALQLAEELVECWERVLGADLKSEQGESG